MFKTKLLIAGVAIATASPVAISFIVAPIVSGNKTEVELVSVKKDIELSNYNVELSKSVLIDAETFDVIDEPVYIKFSYDVCSNKDYVLNVDYRFNFTAIYDEYKLDHVEFANHIGGDIINGSAYSTFKAEGSTWKYCTYFPKTQHEVHAEETVKIEEVMKLYFTVDSDLSRESRLAALKRIGYFASEATVTIIDATATVQ